MGKKLLRIEYDYGFILMGIVSGVKDYRLCWHLNQETFLNLEKIDDLRIGPGHEESFHSRYKFSIEHTETDFYLLANKGSQLFLVPEMKQVDYFLIVYNLMNHMEPEKLVGEIGKMPVVQAAFNINPAELRSKENLLF